MLDANIDLINWTFRDTTIFLIIVAINVMDLDECKGQK